jgi:DNA-directed RNA polymerase specialized sigma24 family protein
LKPVPDLRAGRRKAALDYASTDWAELYRRLWVYAAGLACEAPDIFDGVSAADLVNETMLAFLMSPKALGWQPNRGELSVFLSGVMRHKFLDHLKRQRRVAGSIDDDAVRAALEGRASSSAGLLGQLAGKQWIARLRKSLAPHRDLQDVVAAAAATDGGHNSNQQIADALGTTPREVANRKKRILRILLGGSK